jgi:hypothetical protein
MAESAAHPASHESQTTRTTKEPTMTTEPTTTDTSWVTEAHDLDTIEEASRIATDILRRRIDEIEQARDTQPARLAHAREEAEQARDWAGIEEPWHQQMTNVESVDGSASLTLPNWIGKEVYGARLAFDILDCSDDIDRQNDVMNRYFTMVNGDAGTAMLLMWAALTTIATAVVPMMLEEIETGASNYDARVLLAEARTNAWSARVSVLRAEEAANRRDHQDDDGDVW